jgi:flagellar FliJ protein
MKKKSERLKIVLDLAARKEQAALEFLSKRKRYRDEQLSQLSNLKHYHAQYLDDMKNKVNQVHNALSLQANLQFLSQIDQAILQQEGVLAIAEREYAQALKSWTQLHQKRKGMGDLIDNFKQQEDQLADKKMQQQIESDLLARRFRG